MRQLLHDHYSPRAVRGGTAGQGASRPGDGPGRDHPGPAGDRARPAAGHPVRHGDRGQVRLAETRSARLLRGRRGPVPARRAALPNPGETRRDRGGPRLLRRRARRDHPPPRERHRQTARRPGRRARRRRHPRPLRRPDPGAVHPGNAAGHIRRLQRASRCGPGALRAATAKAAAKPGKMRTRLPVGQKPNRKRMAALVTVYDAEPAPRRPHDVIAPPGRRHGTRAPRPGPRAHGASGCPSQSGRPAEVIATAFDEAEARDPGYQRTRGRPRRRRRAPAVPDPRRGRPPRRHRPYCHRHHPRARVRLGRCAELPRGRATPPPRTGLRSRPSTLPGSCSRGSVRLCR